MDKLPPLTIYRLVLTENAPSALERKIGGKLAYRMRKMLPGHWVWAGGRLFTDTPPNPVKLMMTLDEVHAAQPDTFEPLQTLEEVFGWAPPADVLADYVVRGPLDDLSETIQAALAKTAFTLRNARVEREFRARTWDVNGQPALSLTVVSRLLYEPDVMTFTQSLEKPADLVGFWAGDRTSSLQGEIIRIVGTAKDHRERLIDLSQREAMRALIGEAQDDDLVLRIASGGNEYDYVAGALSMVVRLEDIGRFDINPEHAEKALHLNPMLRAQMVKVVSDVAKEAGLIDNAFSVQNAPDRFISSAPKLELYFGGNSARPYEPDKLIADFVKAGLLWRRGQQSVRVAVLNTLADEVNDFLEALRRSLDKEFQFTLDLVRERKVRVVSQANIESAVRLLAKENPDLMLVFLEDDPVPADEDAVGDRYAKAQIIGRGLPCLVIHSSTLHRAEAMNNLIMGVLARAGNIPYLLNESPAYADYIAGLHLVRQERKDHTHLTAITRIYRGDGMLMRACVSESKVGEDEGIPDAMLASLFPREIISGQRVVLHHDGRMRRDVLRALGGWEAEIDATFLPVEISQRSVPRLYALRAGKIEPPAWGTTFQVNEREAFVVTSTPYGATPQPLHVRAEPPLTIEDAIHSVITFTLFHYGALRRPKLPVTLHNVEFLEAGALRGVLPGSLESEAPFWL